jgi:hypothetical protein
MNNFTLIQKFLIIFVIFFAVNHGCIEAQFTESFEVESNGGFSVPGWAVIPGSSDDWGFTSNASLARTGTRVALAIPSGQPLNDWLISPMIRVQSGVNDRFSLYARAATNNRTETLTLKVATNAGVTPSDFTVTLNNGNPFTFGTDAFELIEVNLSAYIGQTIRVGILARGQVISGSEDAILMDDVISGPAAPADCSALPVISSFERVNGGNYNLFWSGTPNAFQYDVLVVPVGTAVTANTIRTGFTNGTGALIAIPPNAPRDVYVRAQCAGGTSSAWSTPVQITYTPCTPAPTNIETYGVPGVDVVVSYDPVPSATSYGIVLAPPGNPRPNVLNDADLTTTETTVGFSSNNTSPGQSVDIYVRTNCADGEVSDWAGPSRYTYNSCGARATDLSVGTGSGGQPQLNWTAATGAASYFVIASESGVLPDLTTQPLGNPTATSFDLNDLAPGTTYDLYVQVDCGNGARGQLVGPVSFTPECAVPSNLFVSTGIGVDIEVSFSPVTGVGSYEIVALPQGSAVPVASTSPTYTTTLANQGFTGGLSSGTTYDVYVRSVCTDTERSDWSAPVSYTYRPCTNVPRNVNLITRSDGRKVVTWDAAPGAINYTVDVVPEGEAPDPFTTGDYTTGLGATAVLLEDNLQTGQSYDIYVRSLCGGPSSAFSTPFTFNNVDCATPSTFTVATSPGVDIQVSISAVSVATAYEVVALAQGSGPPNSTTVPTYTMTSTNEGFTGGLTAGVTYDIYIRSVCGSFRGAWSSAQSFTFQSCTDCPYDVFDLPLGNCSIEATALVDGSAADSFVPILGPSGNIMCAIQTSADLGTVTARVYGNDGPLRSAGLTFADRNITIKPSNPLSGSATAVVKLYLMDGEVQRLVDSGVIESPGDAGVYKVSGTSCSLKYPGGIELPTTGQHYGTAAWEYTVTVDDFSEFFVSSQSAALPAELTSFNGRSVDEGNVLTWVTATEDMVDRFVIERSEDGKEYQAIGSVRAAGTSQIERTYTFLDANPAVATYYRLRTEDEDGSFAYSPVISITSGKYAGADELQVSPNPNDGSFRVAFSERTSAGQLVVMDAFGRTVEQIDVAIGQRHQPIRLNGLSPGAYTIRIVGHRVGTASRFIVR